jgi:hypothetical protein
VAPESTAETGTGGIVGFTFISSSLVSDAGPVDPVSRPLEGSASPHKHRPHVLDPPRDNFGQSNRFLDRESICDRRPNAD